MKPPVLSLDEFKEFVAAFRKFPGGPKYVAPIYVMSISSEQLLDAFGADAAKVNVDENVIPNTDLLVFEFETHHTNSQMSKWLEQVFDKTDKICIIIDSPHRYNVMRNHMYSIAIEG